MTKKEKCFAVIIGCATFAIFALILEGTCNALILGGGRAAALMQKPLELRYGKEIQAQEVNLKYNSLREKV